MGPKSPLLLLLSILTLPLPAMGAVGEFAGGLTVFIGDGAGNLAGGPISTAFAQSGASPGTAFGSFMIPMAAFSGTIHAPIASTVGGPVGVPTGNTFFDREQTVSFSGWQTGTLGPGLGPSGGFGGTLRLAGSLLRTLGIGAAPGFALGSVTAGLAIGAMQTSTGRAVVLSEPVTISMVGTGWTTGTITYGGGALGAATQGTVAGELTSFISNAYSTTVANVRQFSLVTPIVVRASGVTNSAAGYAVLRMRTVHFPEPGTGLLVAGVALVLTATGWRRGSRAAVAAGSGASGVGKGTRTPGLRNHNPAL